MEKIRIFCRDQILEATLNYFEGELMILGFPEAEKFGIGEQAIFNYQNNELKGKVIAVNSGRLYLFVKLNMKDFSHNRRKFPRIPVDMKAVIMYNMFKSLDYDTKLIELVDVSHNGIGFYSPRKTLALKEYYHVILYTLDPPVVAKVYLLNQIISERGVRYGAEIVYMPAEAMDTLRQFILFKQITGK